MLFVFEVLLLLLCVCVCVPRVCVLLLSSVVGVFVPDVFCHVFMCLCFFVVDALLLCVVVLCCDGVL